MTAQNPVVTDVWFFQPRTLAKANYANSGGREQTWTPWWACYLAPAATAAGLRTHLIDARTDPAWQQQVARLGPGDVLAVTTMTGAALRDALAASQMARAAGSYVVWGGPHATLFPTQCLAESPANAVVPGFGHAGFALLMRRLTGTAEPVTAGPAAALGPRILTEGGDPVPLQASRTARPASGALVAADDPLPSLGLIRCWENYVNPDVAIADRTVNYVTSEGCLRRCTFCSEPQTSGHAWYVRPVTAAVDTIAEMVNLCGATGIKLHDPNFFHDLDRAGEFGRRLAQTVGVPWAASLHPADLQAMTDEQLHAAAAAGLCRVLVGLETPVPELIKLSNKRYDPAGIPAMARRLTAAGIRGMFTFIVGWPGADPGHYQQTIDCAFAIRDLDPRHQCKIHFLEPWPGTPISTLLQRHGYGPMPTTLAGWADVDYYQAQIAGLHDPAYTQIVRDANRALSPYVDA
ncbi:B12-binding domain-containing radical SAM protein [Paractinoplanes rishiriensis]|uniref:B12-binding domain-containing radical SAM protein n=1 Tax=Paractinoplanes rishiriensis TaxID=1050105 RepID=A0A919KA46_9ACTN|nr:B12-binding domain-containing radical SAM protein [Actinoplanes rishiriensis]